MVDNPRVAIFLSTFNGERFLREQLTSIAAQTFKRWTLHAVDDGSTDRTLSILSEFCARAEPEQVIIRHALNAGFVRNFLDLGCDAEISADYYAFSDQDDVWHADKLERAIGLLRRWIERPALYCSRTRLIDEKGRTLGYSPLFSKQPCFRNALVQSIAGANTMVFNARARILLMAAGGVPVPSHDWWLYLLTSGAGGVVYYDPHPSIDYRIHTGNVIGSNRGWTARMTRLRRLLRGHFSHWIDQNLDALNRNRELLTPENRQVLETFASSRRQALPRRLWGLVRSGVHRQTTMENLAIYAAASLSRL
jgi:glycosyltransferase involved in cell wall biosynthesis